MELDVSISVLQLILMDKDKISKGIGVILKIGLMENQKKVKTLLYHMNGILF
jgi:hypothetical protein